MSGKGSSSAKGGLGLKDESTVTAGRMENYSENAAINIDFTSKLFYMYREVVLLLIISFPQDEVSGFLFGIINAIALARFFSKTGQLTSEEFDKIVWFLVNSENYVSRKYPQFFNQYSVQYLNSKEFNPIQASKSISIIICRYLFTIIRTNQNPQRGGMDREPSEKSKIKQKHTSEISEAAGPGIKAERKAREEAKRLAQEKETARLARLTRLSQPKETRDKMSKTSQFTAIDELIPIVGDYKYIVDKCDIIESILEEPYLNHNNIDPIPPELTSSDNPPPPVKDGITNEGKIDENLADSVELVVDSKIANDVLNTIVELQPREEEGRRKCTRFIELAEQKKIRQEQLRNEANIKKQIALELAIKAKQELDEALANAAGQTYIGINTLINKYHPFEREQIVIPDSKLLPILAMKQKAIETGARNKLQNNIIPNKVSVVKFLVELGLLSASGDINDDEEDNQGGGAGPNLSQKQKNKFANVAKKHIGNSTKVKNEPKKKTEEKQTTEEKPTKPKVADPRGIMEGIGAQNQCGAAIGSLEKIPRVKCYICGELGKLPNMKTMECEHIFCVGLAAQYFGLLRATSFSEEQKNVLSILYAWAHRCCNQLKSNLSFMRFKSKPKETEFEFYETNAKELLRNIYDNTEKYDCKWVDAQIKKTYKNKQLFVEKRTAVLGRYCRPLIEEINEVKSQLFHYNPQLFSFMSILKVAATTLVLLTGDKGAQNDNLYLKSTDTIPLCRLLLLKDLETEIKKSSRRGGGSSGGQSNKIQYGGTFDQLSVEEVYNANWGQLMKFMIQSTNATKEYYLDEPQEEAAAAASAASSPSNTDFDTIITIMNPNDNPYELRFDIPSNVTHQNLVDIVNTVLSNQQKPTRISPNGSFNVINQETPVKITTTLSDVIQNAKLSAENTIQIHYYPPAVSIFKLLALNHKINPYSLIAALLYTYSDEPQPDDEYSQDMLDSIMTIIPPEYKVPNAEVTREAASVLLLLHLVSQSQSSPLPLPNIQIHLSDQEAFLSSIQSELLLDPSQTIDENVKQALGKILLIVHPDELPADEEIIQQSIQQVIQDILTFIHDDDNKNAKYSSLITTLLGNDIERRFKMPQLPQEDGNDYKSDDDDDDDHGEGSDNEMVSDPDRKPRQNTQIIVSRIRNLLIVIAGVYFAYGQESFTQFTQFVHSLKILRMNADNAYDYFKIWLTEYLSVNNDEQVNDVWKQIVSFFCSDKLILYTNEKLMSPIIGSHNVGQEPSDMSLDYSFGNHPQTPEHNRTYNPYNSYNPSLSPDSPDSSQLLSPSTHPPPQQNIDEHLVYLVPKISESIFTDDASVFDGVNFDEYLKYFTRILAPHVDPNTEVTLKVNPQGRSIQEPILHIQQRVSAPASRGGKANKKKSTKRRTPRHRQHKHSQYSKKKRNTSSKRKKRLSIKHKKSQPKYHDTRKRRK